MSAEPFRSRTWPSLPLREDFRMHDTFRYALSVNQKIGCSNRFGGFSNESMNVANGSVVNDI